MDGCSYLAAPGELRAGSENRDMAFKKRYLSTPTRLFHMFYVRQLAVVFQYEPLEPCAHKSSQQMRDQRDTLNNAVTRAAA